MRLFCVTLSSRILLLDTDLLGRVSMVYGGHEGIRKVKTDICVPGCHQITSVILYVAGGSGD